jgi:hypothetical protein
MAYTAARPLLIAPRMSARLSWAMTEKPQPDPVPVEDPPPKPVEPLQISTPVINMQDLGRNPGPDTRVPNKGVRVEPRMSIDDSSDPERDDEEALVALEQIEKAIRGQLPG